MNTAPFSSGSEMPIRAQNMDKYFDVPSGKFFALKDIRFEIGGGEFVAVVGRSGSGKSTLLNLIAGIDRPSRGELWVAGQNLSEMDEGALTQWRGQSVGIVFQFFQLLPTLTVLENVMLPMDFASFGTPLSRHKRAEELLEMVGISDRQDMFPDMLSGGQQQRAAIARAMANDPPIVIADEPTGNLDSSTAEEVLELFVALCKSGKTVVMVTHERDIRRMADRTLTISDGRIVDEASRT